MILSTIETRRIMRYVLERNGIKVFGMFTDKSKGNVGDHRRVAAWIAEDDWSRIQTAICDMQRGGVSRITFISDGRFGHIRATAIKETK